MDEQAHLALSPLINNSTVTSCEYKPALTNVKSTALSTRSQTDVMFLQFALKNIQILL